MFTCDLRALILVIETFHYLGFCKWICKDFSWTEKFNF